jgi:Mg-chelatase subunit ChlD
MKEFRRWAFWRRVQYGLGFLATVVLIVGGTYRVYFYSPGDCFDNAINRDERGVDCGGSCVRICAADTLPPTVLWAESFNITGNQYNAVAYVENVNRVASAPLMKYTFEFYNGTKKVGERSGETVLPPSSIYPIFEGRIVLDSDAVTSTTLRIEPIDLWVPATVGRGQFKTTNLNLTGADFKPRLEATIENTELTTANQIEVVATLFNTAGQPVTASQTFIDSLDGRSVKDIVFTWPNSIAKTVRSCEIPSDIVMGIDVSGSMNNDGGTPPQPITDALAAAKRFVLTLKPTDQAALVTFATQAFTPVTFSSNHTSTAAVIEALTISAADEVGYTNTVAALKAAQVELSSPRHSPNARRALILLTDGLPTAQGDTVAIVEEAKSLATELGDSGIEIYAIGLGAGVNKEFINEIASDEANAYYAPTTSDLDSIYANITGSLCESGATRIDVIAKTPTNFTPLEGN